MAQVAAPPKVVSKAKTPPEPAQKAKAQPEPAPKAVASKAKADAATVPGKLVDEDKIQYVHENPKTPGSASYMMFEAYKKAKNVKEALVLGAAKGDIVHDIKKGFCKRV